MYNNEKVKEIQRVKQLSLQDMRKRRLELFTDFGNKRTAALTEVTNKRQEVVTLEDDGKVEINRLTGNSDSEITVDIKHKVDNNTAFTTGIGDIYASATNEIKRELGKYTEGHTVPLAHKLGSYTVGDLISKYNAKIKLPKKSIVFDYTQGVSGYDMTEGRTIRPEGYDSGIISKGEGIFESNDGLLKGRLLDSCRGLFVGGGYENIFITRFSPINQGPQINFTYTHTPINDKGALKIDIECTRCMTDLLNRHTTWSEGIFYTWNTPTHISYNYNVFNITGMMDQQNITPILINLKNQTRYTLGAACFIPYNCYIDADMSKNRYSISGYFQVSKTKSVRPFIKPNYNVPDTNINYPIYRDFKVIVLKMEKLYPEYDTINLLGDDKFILQVKKGIQTLFTRDKDNVFIFDKVNRRMYINGIEVSNKLFNYVELHTDLVCWYSHTSYKENYNDKRGRWFDLSPNGYHMDHIENVSGDKVGDAVRFSSDDNGVPHMNFLHNLSGESVSGVTLIVRTKTPYGNNKSSPLLYLMDSGRNNIVGSEYLTVSNIANSVYLDSRCYSSGTQTGYISFGGGSAYIDKHCIVNRLSSNKFKVMYNNKMVCDRGLSDMQISLGRVRIGFSGLSYPTNYYMIDAVIYKKYLTDAEVQEELNKLEW